jgi:Tfp pilus assembly major pilin PilA
MKKQGGFLLIEVVIAFFILTIFGSIFISAYKICGMAMTNYKLNIACKLLANDIASAQAEVMYNDFGETSNSIVIHDDHAGYSIFINKKTVKKVDFADYNCGDVYLASNIQGIISFTSTGAPRVYTVWELIIQGQKHILLKIQPVTGRIVFEEL